MTGLKQLHHRAEQRSGVPRDAVQAARDGNLYERIGAKRLGELSERFYERVYADEGWFRGIFANSTREDATRNQREFLAQEFGGPRDYEKRKGWTALLGRHGAYAVDGRAAERWLTHMEGAVGEVGIEGECRELVMGYFRHMAWYVVFGRELVNGERTVGYYGKHRQGHV